MSFDPNVVEPKVRPLVLALNRLPTVETNASCEGHAHDAFKSPYVSFRADPVIAGEIEKTLHSLFIAERRLSYRWQITGHFGVNGIDHDPTEPLELRFILASPKLNGPVRLLRRVWRYRVRRRVIDRDLELIEQALKKFPDFG